MNAVDGRRKSAMDLADGYDMIGEKGRLLAAALRLADVAVRHDDAGYLTPGGIPHVDLRDELHDARMKFRIECRRCFE